MKRLLFRREQPVEESPCGLAFDEEKGEAVIAEYASDGGFEIHRVPADERRAVNINASDVRTCVLGWNAHTSLARLPVTAESTDEEILRSIIEAANTDPNAAAFNFTYSRTPDRLLTLTQAETADIADTLRKANAWLDTQRATHLKQDDRARIRLETRTRCNMRLWLSSGVDVDTCNTAFLTVGAGGYAMGLWSPHRGYIYETEERFERGASLEMIAAHTRDVLIKFIAPSSLAQLGLDFVGRVVVSAVPALEDHLFQVLREAPELHHALIEGIRLNYSTDRATEGDELDYATTLALGALIETELPSPVDLSVTPQEQLEQFSESHKIIEVAQVQKIARKARLAMAAPVIVVAAFLATTWFQNRAEALRISSNIEAEKQTAAQLKQATEDYESSKKNFGMFRSLLDNLISLRQRQPATHQLLRDLDTRWPRDASWYVAEVNVKGTNVEIKGRTRNEQAITAFAKTLEFSDGLFTNILTNNNVAGTSLTGTSATATPQSSNVIEFTVRANYSPMKTPGQVGTTATQAPAATMPSAPASTPSPAAPSQIVAPQPPFANGANTKPMNGTQR
jgi:Tfp pilus assembly protein PilN/alkylhydroperoxidase family enzyme